MPSLTDTPVCDPVLWNDWYVVARSLDLEPGSLIPVRLLETDVVVWRSHSGAVMAWADRCPHRSVRLSRGRVVGDTLVCPYHGMVYDQTGQCIQVPAHPGYVPPPQACTQAYAVQEQYGFLFVCLGEPRRAIASFPEWELDGFRTILCGSYALPCSGFRAIENFLDLAHFPFVHDDSLGDVRQSEIGDYTVVTDEQGVRLKNIPVWQPNPVGLGEGCTVTYDYWAIRPLTAYLRKNTTTGECLTILFWVTPVTPESCVGWMAMAVNYGDASEDEDIRVFQDQIVQQDLIMLASHNPKRLPLDGHWEFHVPCDRGSLAYRKWLKTLGVTYGVVP